MIIDKISCISFISSKTGAMLSFNGLYYYVLMIAIRQLVLGSTAVLEYNDQVRWKLLLLCSDVNQETLIKM